jgi:hypothetical protein
MITSSTTQHLHYGGSLNSKGRLSQKPTQKTKFAQMKRMELIVRLVNAQLTHAAIAVIIGISSRRLSFLMNTSDYLQARMKITHGLIIDYEGNLENIKEQRREILTEHLPAALLVIANELQRPATTLAERKHQTAIAQDLLDREGSLAKISRAEVKPVDFFDFERADKESAEIIAAIRNNTPTLQATDVSAEALRANKEFSNSHTLSAVDQQAALDTLDKEKITEKTLEDMKPVGNVQ